MKRSMKPISLSDVQAVYSGPEGDLWELVMGQQIHIGGFVSSMDLAARAGIGAGQCGIDLCCCNGAGMRFLVRFRGVARMTGVDATEKVIERGRRRCAEEELSDRIRFVKADVCETGLPSGEADFVWGEDAWCYVVDKPRLIAEATRLVKGGGVIAFTDWLEGPTPMTDDEAQRFLAFMKFPNIETLEGYRQMLEANGCEILAAETTERFAPCVDLYMKMITSQLTFDALRIINFDQDLLQRLGAEMAFARDLGQAGKISQGMIVAQRR